MSQYPSFPRKFCQATEVNIHFYLGLSVLQVSKSVTYGFWYDSIKPKYGEKNYVIWITTVSL